MNVTSFVQNRQYGAPTGRTCSHRKVEEFLEAKLTKSFVNKSCEISGKCRSTFIMKFSPDGTKVASTHGDHSVRVTDVATGKILYTLLGHPRTPWSLAYHPSISNILASGCLAGQVRIWDLYGHGSEVWTTEHDAVVAGLAFHPTDRVLVIAANNTIYFWDWTKAAPFAKCSTNHEYERIRWIQFDNLGHTLYTGISNNTSVHRDQLASTQVSNISDEAPPPSNRQAHLSSVYNDLVSYYQGYQRERNLNQLEPSTSQLGTVSESTALTGVSGARSGADGHITSGLDADLYPGVHDDDIVRPRSPTERSRSPRSNPQGTADALSDLSDTIASMRRNELLYGAFDPHNPHSSVVDRAGELSQQGLWRRMDAPNSGVQLATETVNPSLFYTEDALVSEHGHSVPTVPTHSEPYHVARQTGLITEALPGTSSGRSLWSQTHSIPILDNSGEIEIPLEAVTGQLPRIIRREHVTTSSRSSQSAGSVSMPSTSTSASRQTQPVASNIEPRNITYSANLPGSIPSTSTASVSTSASNTAVPEVDPQSLLLSRYICERGQKSSDTSARSASSGRGFASIRERLQSSVPLCPVTSSSNKVSYTDTVGIPKVTVIMSSQASASYTSQAPTSKGTSHITDSQRIVNNLSTGTSTQSSATNTLCYSALQTGTNASATISSDSIFSVPVTNLSSSATTTCVDLGHSVTANSTRRRCATSTASSTGYRHGLSINSQTVVASTSSHTSLFQNIFHDSVVVSRNSSTNASQHSQRGRNYLPSFRSQPYSWQNRTRYSSLMGPYLQSRGVHASSTESEVPVTGYLSAHATLGLPSELHPNISDVSIHRDQASSDTENELSAHLNTSEAYFMPIPEDQQRANSSASLRSSTLSSTNTSRNAQDILSSSQRINSVGSVDSIQGQAERSESASSQGSRSGSAVGQRSRSNSQDNEIELVVDQNENYTTNRNHYPDVNRNEEIVHRDHDSNNNSIHLAQNNNITMNSINQRVEERNHDYVRLRDCFVSMTDQIEREMNDLNRRINALRDSFNESIRSLRQDRRRYENLGFLRAETATNLVSSGDTENPLSVSVSGNTPLVVLAPVLNVGVPSEPISIAVSSPDIPTSMAGSSPLLSTGIDLSNHINSVQRNETGQLVSQPPTLLETSLNTHTRNRRHQVPIHLPSGEDGQESQSWRTLQRHYLHPHYSTSILDDAINRPHNVIQRAINRAIAGAFMGSGEPAVANNIINQTHRIQHWDFTRCDIPDISQSTVNIVVPHCKLHNGASADISQDGTLLATFVPNHQGFPDNNILAVYSLTPGTRGTCLYTKQFGPNAVSVSISPCNNHILVCLAARRLSWVFTSQQLVAHIYKLEKKQAGEDSMKHVKDVDHMCGTDVRTHVSGNSACWLPLPGQGIIYGTNRGDLNICRPGVKVIVSKGEDSDSSSSTMDANMGGNFNRLFGNVPWRRMYNNQARFSISTQTGRARVRRSTGTQTSDSTEQLETLV